ncbi:putative NAD-dependent epimerase/dehydratase, NAD(P)-binding domain superfamily [Helianthus anomalus]
MLLLVQSVIGLQCKLVDNSMIHRSCFTEELFYIPSDIAWSCLRECRSTINLAAICTPADYNTRPLDTIYSNFIDALPVVKYCSENNKRLIHFSTCEVYGKTIGSFLPKDSPLRQDPAYYILKEDTSPCIFGSVEKQRWSYACAKQLIERLIYGEQQP